MKRLSDLQRDYEQLLAEIRNAPMTWLPGILCEVVRQACEKGCFVAGGAAVLANRAEEDWRRKKENEDKP